LTQNGREYEEKVCDAIIFSEVVMPERKRRKIKKKISK